MIRPSSGLPGPGSGSGSTHPRPSPSAERKPGGDDSAAELLDRAWDLALDNGSLAALAPAGLALIESAWLAGDISRADDQITLLLERTTTPGGSLAKSIWTPAEL